ncbi:MAG TPA: hypothetical protein VIL46_01775, partial [Gemmataceae bacterium]
WTRMLPPGRHTVEIDGVEVAFTTAEGFPEPAQPKEVAGFPLAEDGTAGAFPVTGRPAREVVRGAHAGSAGAEAMPRVVLCRRGAEKTVFVSCDGRAWTVTEPGVPAWWARLPGPPSSYCFELELHGIGGWILQRRKGRWQVEPAFPTEPGFRPGPQHRAWAAAVLEAADGLDDPLWKSCVQLAEEVGR